jgi:hypothetical protein
MAAGCLAREIIIQRTDRFQGDGDACNNREKQVWKDGHSSMQTRV